MQSTNSFIYKQLQTSMKILIKTPVGKDYKTVWSGFNRDLFEALKPPFLPLTLKRFDGSRTGDEVHIQLGFGILKQDWNALIIEHDENEQECYFVDEGSKLPFFLKTWYHKHRIIRQADGSSVIVDDIDFTTPFKLMDYIMYPLMYMQFAARQPIYKKVFSKKL